MKTIILNPDCINLLIYHFTVIRFMLKVMEITTRLVQTLPRMRRIIPNFQLIQEMMMFVLKRTGMNLLQRTVMNLYLTDWAIIKAIEVSSSQNASNVMSSSICCTFEIFL